MPFFLGTFTVALAVLSALWGKGLIPASWELYGMGFVFVAGIEGFGRGKEEARAVWEPKLDARQLRISELCREQDALLFQVEALKKDLAAAYHGKESGNGH